MSELDALLAGIVSDPREETRWLVLADWLDENDQSDRAELLRLHRRLIATCLEPDSHPERADWQARMVELLVSGVRPCVPQHTFTLPGGVPLTLSFIPPGAFLMGSNHPDGYNDEKPVHRVELTREFFLGVYPVTQAQWLAVMDTDPSHFKGPNRPVEQVSWDDCQEFCAKAAELTGHQVQLPTEAEWEYACRAGTTTEFHFGDVITTDLANYNGDHLWNGSPKGEYREQTTDVGTFPPNGWGLYDVHGNVWESCQDSQREYKDQEEVDPIGLSKHLNYVKFITRGGGWTGRPDYCRAAARIAISRRSRSDRGGFRVCLRPD